VSHCDKNKMLRRDDAFLEKMEIVF